MKERNMNISSFEKRLNEIANNLNWDRKDPWISKNILKSASQVEDIENKELSAYEKDLAYRLGRTYTFTNKIADVIKDDTLSVIEKIKSIYKENSVTEFDENELIAALITGKAKTSTDLYQVIIPTINQDGVKEYNSMKTPYLLKDEDGEVITNMTSRSNTMLSNQSEKTLFTKREIEYNHPHLLEFMYQAQTGHVKDANWFQETVKIIFSDSNANPTDWSTSEIVNNVKRNLTLKKSPEVKLVKTLPVKIHRSVVSKMTTNYSSESDSSKRNKSNLLELIEAIEDNEWLNKYWLTRETNVNKLLLALFSKEFIEEEIKYQFAIPELDSNGNVICLTKSYGGLEYKSITLDEFTNKPEETLFTKEEFDKHPQFLYLWDMRVEEDEWELKI